MGSSKAAKAYSKVLMDFFRPGSLWVISSEDEGVSQSIEAFKLRSGTADYFNTDTAKTFRVTVRDHGCFKWL